MPQSLPLITGTWDLVLDQNGNLSRTDEATSIAQDVSSAIRTFLGECRYNNLLGMPYFESILWTVPPGSLVTSFVNKQALTIDGVKTCAVASLSLVNRRMTGVAVITTNLNSKPATVTF